MIDHQKDVVRSLLKKIMKINLHFYKLFLVLAIVLEFISLTNYSKSVLANPTSKSTYAQLSQLKSSNNNNSLDFSGTGRPNDQTHAASRGSCEGIKDKIVTALVPTHEGATISTTESPKFWVYIPYKSENLSHAELVLQDDEKTYEIARIHYEPQNTPGIVRVDTGHVALKSEDFLEPSKIHRWQFRVVCNNGNDHVVGGFIQGGALDSHELNYDSYLSKGYWYDALTHLAERLIDNPQNPDLRKDWTNLMNAKGVELTHLAEEFNFGSLVFKP